MTSDKLQWFHDGSYYNLTRMSVLMHHALIMERRRKEQLKRIVRAMEKGVKEMLNR